MNSPAKWFNRALRIAVLALAMRPLLATAYSMAARLTTEREAQANCPKDVFVWVDRPTGVYHFKGQRWYGNTKSGAYECCTEADQAGRLDPWRQVNRTQDPSRSATVSPCANQPLQ